MVAAARESEVRYSHEMAYKVATLIATWMHPHVERCEIAGSLRRGRADVKDIEMVLIPKASWLQYTDELLTRGDFTKRHAWGTRFRAGVHVRSGIPVDMFVADSGNWGWTLALRTGPGDVNERLMTWLKTNHAPIKSHEGYWWHGERRLITPTEQDVFDILGIPFVPPEQREIATYRVRLNDPARQWPDFSRWYEPVEDKPTQQGGIVGDERQSDVGRFTPEQWHAMREYDARFFLDWYTRQFEMGLMPVTEERVHRVIHFTQGTALQEKGKTWAAQWRSSPQFFEGERRLNIDTGGKLNLKADDLAGARIAVLGISGAGKTNTNAVIIEEVIEKIPMTIVDIEGEYWGLRERHEVLVVGRSEQAMLDVPAMNAGDLARFAYAHGLSVILDMSEHDQEEMFDFVEIYFEALWKCAAKGRKPYGVVIEECHEFIPQSQGTPVKTLFKRYAKRGRKQGITLILSSQRSSEVDKGVLTQCGLVFLHRVTHPTDKAVYYRFIPKKPAEVNEMIQGLKPGQAVVIHENEPLTVQVRKRTTFHAGFTPSLDASKRQDAPALRPLDENLLDEIKAVVLMNVPKMAEDVVQLRIRELERKLETAEKRAELYRSRALALLKKLRLPVQPVKV